MLALGLLILTQAMPATTEGSNEDGERRPDSALCSAVQVTSPQIQGPQLPGYSASQILDLRLRTILDHPLDGQHVLELRVYTPKGHLYQILTVPVTAPIEKGPARMPRGRTVDGHANALSDHAAAVDEEPARKPSFDATLPVGGTSIVTSSLYGRWTVAPHLDGSLKPCGPTRQFRIEQ